MKPGRAWWPSTTRYKMSEADRDNSIAVFGALSLFWFSFQSQRHLIASLLGASSVAEDLGVTAAGAGFLVGVYFPAYGLMQLPSGLLADLYSPRRNLLMAALGMIASGILFGLAPNFPVALLARALVGISSGLVYMSIIKLCANWAEGRQFATVVGFVNVFGNIGAVLSFLLIPALLVSFPWRTTSLLVVIPLLLMPLSLLLVRDCPTSSAVGRVADPASRSASDPPLRSWRALPALAVDARTILARKEFWFYSIMSFMWVGFHFSVISWLPRYCLDVLEMPKAMTGLLPAIMTAGGGIANLAYGPIYVRWRRHVERILIAVNFSYILLLAGFIVAGPFLAGNFVIVALAALTLGALVSSFPVVVAALRDIVPGQMIATGVGIYNGFSFLVGFIYPWLIGIIIDAVDQPSGAGPWTYSSTAYSVAFVGCCLTLLVTLAATLVLTRGRQPIPEVAR